MERIVRRFGKRITAGIMTAVCLAVCTGVLQAEEPSGYYDEAGNWVQDPLAEGALAGEELQPGADGQTEAQALTGTYSVGAGWTEDTAAGRDGKTVYKQDACVGMDATSTISCGYMDTNYSVQEYEQLRDMLTNNLLYENVNAQISTSASYTQSKDYLYIIIVDDSAQDYRDIYNYVVGDYRCFCVEVREYRSEAEQAAAAGQKTPQETGQATAEAFTWDA